MASEWDRTIERIGKAARSLADDAAMVPVDRLSAAQRKALARAVNDASGAVGALKRAMQHSPRQ